MVVYAPTSVCVPALTVVLAAATLFTGSGLLKVKPVSCQVTSAAVFAEAERAAILLADVWTGTSVSLTVVAKARSLKTSFKEACSVCAVLLPDLAAAVWVTLRRYPPFSLLTMNSPAFNGWVAD